MRYICHIESHVIIGIRNFDTACHHAAAVKRFAGRVGNGYSVYDEKIVVKSLCKRICNAGPFAIGITGKVVYAA